MLTDPAYPPTVVTMANDRYLSWFLAFAESFRCFNPTRPLRVIPYDARVEHIGSLSTVYDFSLFDSPARTRIDKLSRKLFPTRPRKGMLNSLLMFDIPTDEFLYIDADTLILHDLAPLLHQVDADRRLIYGNRTRAVYKREYLDAFSDSALFSAGVIGSSRRFIALEEILTFAEEQHEHVREFLHPAALDQGLLNFYVDCTGIPVSRFSRVQNRVHPVAFHRANWFEDRDGRLIHRGSNLPIAIIHWSGQADCEAPDMPLGDLHAHFLAQARGRLAEHGLYLPGQ